MGLDESKLTHSTKILNQPLKLCASGPVIPWRIIHQCSPDLWKKCHREYFNFSDKPITCNYQVPNECTIAFCLTRQNIINCRKSSSVFSLRKRKKFTKMAEHFEYNHIPARLSSIHNLHFKSVLASHSGLAVIHLTRNMITEFAVLDLRLNKFLGSFGRQMVNFHPESTVGKISPDGNWCLIRLPSVTDRQSSVLKLYDLKGCELLTELFLSPAHTPLPHQISCPQSRPPLALYQEDNRQRQNGAPSAPGDLAPTATRSAPVLFAFDPRFLHSRIAITNLNFVDHMSDGYEMKPSVSLMTLPTWERVATTTGFKCPSLVYRASPLSSSSTRTTSGRIRVSDLSLQDDVIHSTAGITYATPHILSIFYSRDGYFLFVVSTEHRTCRCSVIGHHTASSFFPHSPLGSYDKLEDSSQLVSLYSSTVCATDGLRSSQSQNAQRGHTVSFFLPVTNIAASSESRSARISGSRNSPFAHFPMWAPSMPGCTTLWLTIFNSDTLDRLRTLRFDRPVCPVHTCPTNYTPMMSRCGSRFAVITNKYASVPQQRSGNPITSTLSGRSSGDSKLNSVALLRHSVPSINIGAYDQQQTRLNYSRNSGSKTDVSGENRVAYPGSSSLDTSTRELAFSSPTLPPTVKAASPFNTSTLSSRAHLGDSTRSDCERMDKSEFNSTLFSSFSSSLSVNTGSSMMRQVEVVLVYQLPPPPSLQALIRQKIRQIVQDSMLDRLDLPPRLIGYLRFQPTFSCAGSCLSRSNSFCPTVCSDNGEFCT